MLMHASSAKIPRLLVSGTPTWVMPWQRSGFQYSVTNFKMISVEKPPTKSLAIPQRPDKQWLAEDLSRFVTKAAKMCCIHLKTA